MRQIRHPLVERDIIAIAEHILETTDGNVTAAERRLDEIDDLLKDIVGNPFSGVRLSGSLEGWLVRPLSGRAVIRALMASGKPGLFDRLIANGYDREDLKVFTLDRKMATLPNVRKL